MIIYLTGRLYLHPYLQRGDKLALVGCRADLGL